MLISHDGKTVVLTHCSALKTKWLLQVSDGKREVSLSLASSVSPFDLSLCAAWTGER